jgi:amino acid transporter
MGAARVPELPAGDTAETVADTELQGGALRLPAVLMQSITHIAPALGILLTVQFTATLAGVATPLGFLIGFLIVLTLGVSLTQLAKHLPSAGGYFTYLSHAVHPRAGFLVAWIFLLYAPIIPAFDLPYTGLVVEQAIKSQFGVDLPWWVLFGVAVAFLAFVGYRGIRLSARVMIPLGVAEMLIVAALAVSGFARPGPGGLNVGPFNPTNALTVNGLFLAVVFSIFVFTGFEAAAPVAEESVNPRRNVPKAIVGSIIILGVFQVLVSYGLLTGWGTDKVANFASSTENPVFVLARHLWGAGWVLVPLALINSALAVCIATGNVATRMAYAVGRAGAAPRFLTKLHPRYRTPVNAVFAQTIVTVVLGLSLGFALGPTNNFFMMGLVQTLAAIAVYVGGNLAVFLLYRRERRAEFNPVLHLLFPLFSTIALIVVLWNSVNPIPAAPVGYAVYIAAAWLLAGVILLFVMSRTGRERWLMEAGRVASELPADVGTPSA